MAENTVRKEGFSITVGLDTDGDKRIRPIFIGIKGVNVTVHITEFFFTALLHR